jgi:hypothetical protein
MARWVLGGALACSVALVGCGGAAARPSADSRTVSVVAPKPSSSIPLTTEPTSTPTTNPYADDLPPVVRATADTPTVDPNTLAPGTAVPVSAIGSRTALVGSTVYGLANSGPFFGRSYPAVSTDGGAVWRIDGPIFYRAAADGGSGASGIFVEGSLVYVPGVDGDLVRVTTDGGQHWLIAAFPNSIGSVTYRAGRLTTAVQVSPLTARLTYSTRDYVSTDDGRTWYLQKADPAGTATYGHTGDSASAYG